MRYCSRIMYDPEKNRVGLTSHSSVYVYKLSSLGDITTVGGGGQRTTLVTAGRSLVIQDEYIISLPNDHYMDNKSVAAQTRAVVLYLAKQKR